MEMIEVSENQMLMKRALEALKGKWRVTVAMSAVYGLISLGANSIPGIGGLINFLISGAFFLGLAKVFIGISRGETPEFPDLFGGFQRYGTSLIAYFLVSLFTVLWTLLLIVPGIMAFYSYSQTFFLMADDEELAPIEAIRKSKEMMLGYRLDLFYLHCRFIGWFIVGFITAGIGFLWVIPYFYESLALFYEKVTGEGMGSAQSADDSPAAEAEKPSGDISDMIIERVMAMDQSIKDKQALEKEVREVVANLMTSVELSKEEIESVVKDVLREYASKKDNSN